MSPVLQVARKELKELFRDKRVRSTAFFGPIILIMVLFSLMGFVFGQLGKKENTKVHVVKTASSLAEVLKQAKFQVIEVASLEEGQKMIRAGDARVVLVLPGNAEQGVQYQQKIVDAYLDPKQQTGQIALSLVTNVFEQAGRAMAVNQLKDQGIPERALEPIKLAKHDVQVGEKGGASDFLVGLLPYMIVIWAFYGAMGIAGDMVAGEKEKSTLETLLITPVKRTHIVLGKLLALSTVSLLSSLSSLIGIILLATLKPPGTAEMFKSGLGVNPLSAGLILALMIPMAAVFASMLIGVSSYAKNSREAQQYLSQISFVVIMPAIFSQFIGLTDYGSKRWVDFVPILNTANNIRLTLLGKTDYVGILITIGVSLVLALIALRVTVMLFNREEVLVRV
ncbi:MAG TPA: ABC transporter permease [Fimbriimonas sp.]|nr:ABC transporter permease [Fimbriimonas sp.]